MTYVSSNNCSGRLSQTEQLDFFCFGFARLNTKCPLASLRVPSLATQLPQQCFFKFGESLALSADRAFQVKQYLTEQGVPSSRIAFEGLGEAQPIADNSTEAGRALNRRTTFKVISM